MKEVGGPRVCWLPFSTNGRSGSSVYRCALPDRELRRAGLESAVTPTLDPHTAVQRSVDVAVFQKRYSWDDVRLAELLQKVGVKICFDLCDNHRFALGLRADKEALRSLDAMEQLADLVTVPTLVMAGFVDAPNVAVVDDAVEAKRSFALHTLRKTGRRNRTTLIWFGTAGGESPRFGIPDLAEEIPSLEDCAMNGAIELVVLSNQRELYDRYITTDAFPHSYRPWTSTKAAHRLIQEADICILPVGLNEFTIGKSANRAVLSALLGTPVVATAHPAYEGLERAVTVAAQDFGRSVRTQIERRQFSVETDGALRRFEPAVVARRWEDLLSQVVA